MKQADLFIFGGLFILLLGLGDDTGKVFSADIILTVGGAFIIYGILLYLWILKKNEKFAFSFPKKVSQLPARVYLIIGVLILRIDRFLSFISDNLTLIIIQCALGIFISFYGVQRLFHERRMKRESGNIEK